MHIAQLQSCFQDSTCTGSCIAAPVTPVKEASPEPWGPGSEYTEGGREYLPPAPVVEAEVATFDAGVYHGWHRTFVLLHQFVNQDQWRLLSCLDSHRCRLVRCHWCLKISGVFVAYSGQPLPMFELCDFEEKPCPCRTHVNCPCAFSPAAEPCRLLTLDCYSGILQDGEHNVASR
jgi:hypothetical protein